jgi:plasmid maintenance system antidote protein VapI
LIHQQLKEEIEMKIQTKHVVELTIEDIIRLVRDDQEITGDIEIKIIDKVVDTNNGEWIDVPTDWNYTFCPSDSISNFDKIEVQYRRGTVEEIEHAGDLTVGWVQENHEWDVVKFRKIN